MWQDWTNLVIGLWLAISPWLLLSYSEATSGMIWNCVLSGVLIAGFAVWAALSRGEKWQEWVVILFCLWLFVAPGTLRYSVPRVTWDNVIVGLTVGTLALWSLGGRDKTA